MEIWWVILYGFLDGFWKIGKNSGEELLDRIMVV
jgi:hypothetical protein